MNYLATKTPVRGQGVPPDSFLDQLIATIARLPDEVFAADPDRDIYSVLEPFLGPWLSLDHRRAVMCEALRVLAGFESAWNWDCGADTTAGPETPEEEETGAFQVSANSMNFAPSLRICVTQYCGTLDPLVFIAQMKAQHDFAVEYCARLVRFSTRWDGPINRGWVALNVQRAAVAEFEQCLTAALPPS